MPNQNRPPRKTTRRQTRRSSGSDPAAQEQPPITLRLGDDPPPAEKEPNEVPPPEPEISAQIRAAIEAWAESLIDTGARNPLLYYRHLRAGTLDLGLESKADQRRVARMLGGARVLLSSLFPDDEETDVRRRARNIRRTAQTNEEERNIHTLSVAYGMATWQQKQAGPQPKAPILLAAARLDTVGRASDGLFNLVLEDDWEINRSLLYLLRTDHGIELPDEQFPDPIGPKDFDAVFDLIRRACGHLANFEIQPATVLGNFSFAKMPMVDDLQGAAAAVANHPLTAAIAGDPAAVDRIRAMYASDGSGGDFLGDVVPASEFLVLDADGTQSSVIRSALSGNHLVVVGPPGTGKSQTIANLIAELAAAGKHILFVAEKRAAINAVTKRLDSVGLGDLVLDLHEGRRSRARTAEQLSSALEAARGAPRPEVEATHSALAQAREELNESADALHQPLEPWNQSAFDVQSSLLGMGEHEKLAVRLHGNVIEELAGGMLDRSRRHLREYVGHYLDVFGQSELLRAAFAAGTVKNANQADELARTISEMRQKLPEIQDAEQSFAAEPAWHGARSAGTASTHAQAEALIKEVEKTADMRRELGELSRRYNAVSAWSGVEAAGRIRTSDQAERLIARISSALDALRELRTLTESFEAIGAWRAVREGSPPRTPSAAAVLLRSVEQGMSLLTALDASAADLAKRIGADIPVSTAGVKALIERADAGASALKRRDRAAARFSAPADEVDLQGLADALEPARKGFVSRFRTHLSSSEFRSAKSTLRRISSDPDISPVEGQERILRLLAARTAVQEAGAPSNAVADDYESAECAEALASFRDALSRLERAGALATDVAPWDDVEARLSALHADAKAVHLLPRMVELEESLDAALAEIGVATGTPSTRMVEFEESLDAALAEIGVATGTPSKRRLANGDALEEIEEMLEALDRASGELRLFPRMIQLRKSLEVSLSVLQNANALPRSRRVDWGTVDTQLAELEAAGGALMLIPTIIDLDAALREGLKRLRGAKLVPRSRQLNDPALVDELARLDASIRSLRLLPQLYRLRKDLDDAGLAGVRKQVLRQGWSPDAAVRALDRVHMLSVHSVAETRLPRLASFKGEDQDGHTTRFREADIAHISQGAARVRRAWAERSTAVREVHGAQERVVQRETKKKTRHRSIRQLFDQAPDVLTALKPCWAMSPLVVSQLLPVSPPPFDVVIFDEASQIPPADAIPSLLRGRQAIVAGDPKQLPPTAFFTQAGDDDDEREEAEEELLTDDVESILDAMSTLLSSPRASKSLGWHYRSKDERLIAFANHHVYDGRMTTFPGALPDDCISHVEVPFSQRAVQQRGSNSAEVERVVELILEHARERPGESLGVIAFGSQHSNRIEETLLQARRDLPELDEFFSEAAGEPFFVKNLERVQGDERDAIILSVGYGRGADGRMRYAFGPINQEGGYRRLNVAITRAKRRMTIVSAFGPHDLDPDRIRTDGPRLLRGYIAYAASRGAELGKVDVDKPPLNDFEQDIQRRLEAAGVPIRPQYGASGYRIDFAAFHPEQPGRPVLAIEADGAAYHSAPSARDRDRLRQEHLERLGWRFHRIWSTEYFRHPEREIDRAVAAWQSAVAAAAAPEPEPTPEPVEPKAVAMPDPPAPQPQRGPKPNVGPKRPITEYTTRQIREVIDWVNSDNILRTEDETIQEVSRALGFQRRGTRITTAIRNAIHLSRQRQRRDQPPQPEDPDQPQENFRFTTRL